MENIEIKSRLTDRAAVEQHLTDMGAQFIWRRRQLDVFFNVPTGYLKLRRVDGQSAELIAYVRAAGSQPRPSDYDIAPAGYGAALERALSRSLGVRGVVSKERTLFQWHHTRVHLDEVDGLGSFLELEAVAREISLLEARREAEKAIALLGLDAADFLDRPYLELIEAAQPGVLRPAV